MAFCLFEHNEKAYKSTIWMMEQYDKAAIVRLIDTEKSYIEFKMDEDNPETAIKSIRHGWTTCGHRGIRKKSVAAKAG